MNIRLNQIFLKYVFGTEILKKHETLVHSIEKWSFLNVVLDYMSICQIKLSLFFLEKKSHPIMRLIDLCEKDVIKSCHPIESQKLVVLIKTTNNTCIIVSILKMGRFT